MDKKVALKLRELAQDCMQQARMEAGNLSEKLDLQISRQVGQEIKGFHEKEEKMFDKKMKKVVSEFHATKFKIDSEAKASILAAKKTGIEEIKESLTRKNKRICKQ